MVNSASTSLRIASGTTRKDAMTTRSSTEASSNTSCSSGIRSSCQLSASSAIMLPAILRARGSRPQSSTASIAAVGAASWRFSNPPVRSRSSIDASWESVSQCTSAAPLSNERMRVVTTTADRMAVGLMKFSLAA
eukprot:6208404-Prymnesium_polylepis.2